MTREEAIKAAEVMNAYAEGKKIEFKPKYLINWYIFPGECKEHNLDFNFEKYDYRIKKEPRNNPDPTYRPFHSKEECLAEMMKHQPFGWVRYNKRLINIANIDDMGIVYQYEIDLDTSDYMDSLKYMKFADGKPFGIKEE